MKITKGKTHLQTSEADAESLNFGIGDASVIIDILRRRLYTHPLRTMIQEYLCNARDASRESGTGDAIEVYCPTNLDPVFKVRDFGPGLSPDRVRNVFVLYGSSTKREDNSQTGGFGIGAKSAWAYTDSFTIVSIFEGKKYTYIAHLGKNSEGSLDLLDTENTKESSGVEISVSINKQDIQKSIDSIFRATFFWKIKPIFKGIMEVELPDHYIKAPEFSGAGFLVDDKKVPCLEYSKPGERALTLSEPKRSNTFNAFAVVDGIPYEITKALTEAQKLEFSSSTQLYLLFKTGEIQINANREEIVLDESNAKAISEKLLQVVSSLAEHRLQVFKTCDNLMQLKNFTTNQSVGLTALASAFDIQVEIEGACVVVKKKKEGFFFNVSGHRMFDLTLKNSVREWKFGDLRKLLIVEEEWALYWEEFLQRARVTERLPFVGNCWVVKNPVPKIYEPLLLTSENQQKVKDLYTIFIEAKQREIKNKEEEALKQRAMRKHKENLSTQWGLEAVCSFYGQMIKVETVKIQEIPQPSSWVYLLMPEGVSGLIESQGEIAKKILFANRKLRKRVLLTDPEREVHTQNLGLKNIDSVINLSSLKLTPEERKKLTEHYLCQDIPDFIKHFSMDFIEKLRAHGSEEEYEAIRTMKILLLAPVLVNTDEYRLFYSEEVESLVAEVEKVHQVFNQWLERNFFFRVINFDARFWEREAIKLIKALAPPPAEEKKEDLLSGLTNLMGIKKKE